MSFQATTHQTITLARQRVKPLKNGVTRSSDMKPLNCYYPWAKQLQNVQKINCYSSRIEYFHQFLSLSSDILALSSVATFCSTCSWRVDSRDTKQDSSRPTGVVLLILWSKIDTFVQWNQIGSSPTMWRLLINQMWSLYKKVFAWGFHTDLATKERSLGGKTQGKYFPVQTEQTRLIRNILYGVWFPFFITFNKVLCS